MTSRTLWIGLAVALAVVCVCGLAAAVIGAAVFTVASSAQGTATPSPTLNPTQVLDSMDAIQAFVISTRGLQPTEPVERAFLSVADVRQRVIEDFAEDTTPEGVADDARVLAAFGLMDAHVDLYGLLVRLYSEGVAGFYDPDTQELIIVSDAAGFNAYERTTFAHEYNHALQDQVFGIRASGFSDEMWDSDPQRASAIQAVIEGDSSLLEEHYLATFTPAEQGEYDAVVGSFDTAIYRELPPFLLRDFIFPYREGLEFVRGYYDQGGWARVDEVWRDPPVSTEHILHPERYAAGDQPIPVARPALTDTLGSGWRQIDSSVNGEWYTFLILAYADQPDQRLREREARAAAAGWGGDGYVAYLNADSQALVLAAEWVWDTPADADEFAAAFRQYAEKRFGPLDPSLSSAGRECWQGAGPTCLLTQGPQGTGSLWLMAPDAVTLDAVLQQYPHFAP